MIGWWGPIIGECYSVLLYRAEAEPQSCHRPALTFPDASPRGNANFQYLLTVRHSNVSASNLLGRAMQQWDPRSVFCYVCFSVMRKSSLHCPQAIECFLLLYLLEGPVALVSKFGLLPEVFLPVILFTQKDPFIHSFRSDDLVVGAIRKLNKKKKNCTDKASFNPIKKIIIIK